MSYGFDMGFAQANSLQEAMTIALEYTQSQMTEKNIRKTIRDNRYYIPSIRTGYIADEENKNRRADVLADTADRYWLEALFTFRFLYWEEHKLLGIIMMPPESASERWPLSVYFQNSCDQDYPFFEWKAISRSLRTPPQKPKTIRRKKSAQSSTTKSKMKTSNIIGAILATMIFLRNSPSNRGCTIIARMCRS